MSMIGSEAWARGPWPLFGAAAVGVESFSPPFSTVAGRELFSEESPNRVRLWARRRSWRSSISSWR